MSESEPIFQFYPTPYGVLLIASVVKSIIFTFCFSNQYNIENKFYVFDVILLISLSNEYFQLIWFIIQSILTDNIYTFWYYYQQLGYILLNTSFIPTFIFFLYSLFLCNRFTKNYYKYLVAVLLFSFIPILLSVFYLFTNIIPAIFVYLWIFVLLVSLVYFLAFYLPKKLNFPLVFNIIQSIHRRTQDHLTQIIRMCDLKYSYIISGTDIVQKSEEVFPLPRSIITTDLDLYGGKDNFDLNNASFFFEEKEEEDEMEKKEKIVEFELEVDEIQKDGVEEIPYPNLPIITYDMDAYDYINHPSFDDFSKDNEFQNESPELNQRIEKIGLLKIHDKINQYFYSKYVDQHPYLYFFLNTIYFSIIYYSITFCLSSFYNYAYFYYSGNTVFDVPYLGALNTDYDLRDFLFYIETMILKPNYFVAVVTNFFA